MMHATRMVFVNSHLAAHMDHVSKRNEDFESVAEVLVGRPKDGLADDKDGIAAGPDDKGREQVMLLKSQYPIVWLGDLNYRVPMPVQEALDHIHSGVLTEVHDSLASRRMA